MRYAFDLSDLKALLEEVCNEVVRAYTDELFEPDEELDPSDIVEEALVRVTFGAYGATELEASI